MFRNGALGAQSIFPSGWDPTQCVGYGRGALGCLGGSPAQRNALATGPTEHDVGVFRW